MSGRSLPQEALNFFAGRFCPLRAPSREVDTPNAAGLSGRWGAYARTMPQYEQTARTTASPGVNAG